MPNISRMRYQLRVVRPTTIAGVELPVGAILDLDTADASAVVVQRIAWNAGAVVGAMVEGDLEPVAITPAALSLALQPRTAALSPPPAVPRVLAFRPRKAIAP